MARHPLTPPSTVDHQPSTTDTQPSTLHAPPSAVHRPPSAVRPSTTDNLPSALSRLSSAVDRPPSILDSIVAAKRREINELYRQYDFGALKASFSDISGLPDIPFYRALAEAAARKEPFIIAEFKRKSPSEGWIDRDADISARVREYAAAGAGAISVLTDTPFFGGSYDDLRLAASALGPSGILLQKDFILDPIQIYLAKRAGAGIILLIAAILEPESLEMLRLLAESLGIGVIVEVHNQAEFDQVRHLDFPVLGVNNRDLKTFRTALNRFNVIGQQSKDRFLIAESGISGYRDLQILRQADGFLIGTAFMKLQSDVKTIFRQAGRPRLLFKACGIRSSEPLDTQYADFIGFNFSPVSKRRVAPDWLTPALIAAHPGAVAVFYRNSESEIRDILERYPFRIVQLYAEEHSTGFIQSLTQKVMLACALRQPADLDALETFAPYIDLFILDGATPGSGQPARVEIPSDFPYPFLLAGGIHAGNLGQTRHFENCIGADIASGIETDGNVDILKMAAIAQALVNQSESMPIG
jgi:indole-3-glycerol phosphate synthase